MKKPRRWPTYALDCWEGTVYHLKCIDDMAREIQNAAIKAEQFGLVNLTNDIRAHSIDARSLLHQARTGDYET